MYIFSTYDVEEAKKVKSVSLEEFIQRSMVFTME